MNKDIENKTLWLIGVSVMVCSIIAVSNQVMADDKSVKAESKVILAHPDDQIGLNAEQKRIEEAEKSQAGNILKVKEDPSQEKTMGPKHYDNWPSSQEGKSLNSTN